MTGDDLAGTIAWRELRIEARDALAAAGIGPADQESWWLVEEASGMDRTELVVGLEQPATVGGVARLDAMVARRCAGARNVRDRHEPHRHSHRRPRAGGAGRLR